MERQPEEDYHTEHCEQGINTLFDFGCAHLDFFFAYGSILFLGSYNLLCRVGEAVLVDQVDYQ